jgi:SAM-dependent methyltransferase
MPSALKRYAKLFLPSLGQSRHWPAAAPRAQDLDIYWDADFADELDEWGRNTVWPEVDLLFAALTGKVLDIACGTGQAMAVLARNPNLEVHGVDISQRLIDRALSKAIPASRLKVADATMRSYAENEFDYSCSIGSIEHFTEDGIHRVLANAAYYTRHHSFHMLPVNRDGLDKGWEKTKQSYFNNSVEWWQRMFRPHFAEVTVFGSTWAGLDQVGRWFVCRKESS